VARSSQAAQPSSDDVSTSHTLVYHPGQHAVAPGRSQTYAVEADNAALRHYLARSRLARTSRCFARSLDALRRAVKLFVHAWNRRQLHKRAFPRYACHVMDFVCP
jgi:IS1 family transposase